MKYSKSGFRPQFIRDLADSEKPREKMLKNGVAALSNAELMAVLISAGTRDESAISIAQRIIKLEESSLVNLSNYTPEEFMKIKGIGTAKAATLCACFELGKRMASEPKKDRILVQEPASVASLFMSSMRQLNKEYFKVLLLNVHNEIIATENASIGGLTSSEAGPRVVFESAIRRGAAAIILVHNHPGGNPAPSKSDINATNTLIAAGKLMNIEVLDHIIIGDASYYSMKENNQI